MKTLTLEGHTPHATPRPPLVTPTMADVARPKLRLAAVSGVLFALCLACFMVAAFLGTTAAPSSVEQLANYREHPSVAVALIGFGCGLAGTGCFLAACMLGSGKEAR